MSRRATSTLVQARRRTVAACVLATSAVALALPSGAGAMTSEGDGWDPSGTESGGLVTTVSPPPMKDPVGFTQTTVSLEPAAADDAAPTGGTGTVAVADTSTGSGSTGSTGTSVAAAVAPAAGTGSLPFTGLGLAPIALLGALLVAAGAGAYRVGSVRS